MKKQEDLYKLIDESIRRAIRDGAIEINWHPDPETRDTHVEFGFPHKVYISQVLPDELVKYDLRHEMRHIVFGHARDECGGNTQAQCLVIPEEIEAFGFLQEEDDQAYRDAGFNIITVHNPDVKKLFLNTNIPVEYLNRFPVSELHDAICKKKKSNEGNGESAKLGLSGENHCTTHAKNYSASIGDDVRANTDLAKAAAFLLGLTLVKYGYKDEDIRLAISGGRGSRSDFWESFIKVKPAWVDKVLTILSPEFCFERRRYAPRPLWGPLLLSNRWMPSIRSRFSYRPKRAVIIIDTSGSMWGGYVLQTIKAGIRELIERYNLKIRLICGDDEVTWDKEIGSMDDVKLKGGGGTLYEDVYKRAMSYRPDCIAHITDLFPNMWPQKGPEAPVYFIVPKGFSKDVPFGKILCEVEKEGGN